MILVIFDVDGTLVYSDRQDSQCFARAFEQLFGKPFPTIDWTQYPQVNDTAILHSVFNQHFGRSFLAAELDAFQDCFLNMLIEQRRFFPERFFMVPGAKEVIDHLTTCENVVTGIATGGFRRPAQFKLTFKEIRHDHIIFHGADGKYSRQAIIEHVIEEAIAIHGNFNRIVYVGDAIWDVHTTKDMGIPLVGVRYGDDRHVLESAGTRVVIRDYVDIPAFMSALEQAEVPV